MLRIITSLLVYRVFILHRWQQIISGWTMIGVTSSLCIKIHCFFQRSTEHDTFFKHFVILMEHTSWLQQLLPDTIGNGSWLKSISSTQSSFRILSSSPQFNNWALSILVCHAKNMYSIYWRFGHTSSNHYHSSRSDEVFILCFDQNHDKSNSKYLQSCFYSDFMYRNCKLQIYTDSTWAFMALNQQNRNPLTWRGCESCLGK